MSLTEFWRKAGCWLLLLFSFACNGPSSEKLSVTVPIAPDRQGLLLSVNATYPDVEGISDLKRAHLLVALRNRIRTIEKDGGPLWGIQLIASGDYQRSASVLEAAAQSANSAEWRASFYNDAAVAYLNLALARKSPLESLYALTLLDLAAAAAPNSPTIGFNRALILENLHLPDLATEEWQRLFAYESFRDRAASHLANLRARRQHFRELYITAEAIQLGKFSEPTAVKAFTSSEPFLARVAFEDHLLGLWANTEDDDRRTELLGTLTVIGETLRAENRDDLPAQEIRALHSATSSRVLESRLREAHRLYARARQLYEDQDTEEALKLFLASEQLFRDAGSPFEGWAKFHRSICVYYGDSHAADQLLDELERSVDTNFWSLRARIQWMRGTIDQVLGNPARALHRYTLAHDYLLHSGGPSGAAFTNVLIATALDDLGDSAKGWGYRLKALEFLPYGNDYRRVHALLSEAVADLRRQDQAQLSFPIAEQLLRNAKRWCKPMGFADAYRQRARAFVQLGDIGRAQEDLREARIEAGKMPKSRLKASIVVSLDLVEALIQITQDPQDAVNQLDGVFKQQEAAGYEFESLQVFVARAFAFEKQGNRIESERALLDALSYFSSVKAGAKDLETRARVASLSRELSDRLLSLLLDDVAFDEELVLRLADQRRSHVAAEVGQRLVSDVGTLPLSARLAGALPDGVTVIMHSALKDKLLITVGTTAGIRHVIVPIGRGEILSLVAEFLTSVRLFPRAARTRRQAERLYDLLLRPTKIGGNGPVVFIPDPALGILQMGALRDHEEGKWLIQQRACSYYPSLELLIHHKKQALRGTLDSALIVGEPDLDLIDQQRLGKLPGARIEAEWVAESYQEPSLLVGPAATRGHFMEALKTSSILHFAGHVEIGRDSFLQTALLLAPTPNEEDSRVTLSDLAATDLKSLRLAVLSACDTASAAGLRREDLGGLAAVFMAGGTQYVVATVAPVNDNWTPEFMREFHRRLISGLDPVEVFRSLVLAEIDRGGLNNMWWTNYIVFGVPNHDF